MSKCISIWITPSKEEMRAINYKWITDMLKHDEELAKMVGAFLSQKKIEVDP